VKPLVVHDRDWQKNWLFVGSERAGHRAAILTSLAARFKNNFVES
jgi:hypothetical protein